MKKTLTLLALTISFSINAQMDDNSHPSNNSAGTFSVAMGHNNTASGGYSTAMGRNNTASGLYTTVMGESTTASGNYSTAMGSYTTVSGTYSTAMGYHSTASDFASVVIGQYNSSGSSATSAALFSTSNTAFVIGNGTDSSNKSDAFKVMFNGDTYVSGTLFLGGTEITSTAAELNLLDGVSTIGDGILASVTENSNTGVRLSTSNASNHGEIGDAAVDLSKQGASSTTRGATGYGSFASGYNTTASESYSTALGSYTVASGYGSTALGRYTTASGYYSVTMGRGTTASDWGSLVIGRYNSSSSSATSSDSFSTSNPAFVIGNGSDWSSTSDAFKVMFNGDTYVSGSLFLGGTEITSTAAELNLLDGVSTIGDGILASVTENSNTGVRLSTSNAANHGDVGENAVDLSYQNSSSSTKGATGYAATALGYLTTASGNRSTATGNNTVASGHQSTSMGELTTASGRETLAIGNSTTASGNYSTSMGLNTTASGNQSLAIGRSTTASGISSLALGYSTTASGHQSISAGNSSTASASYSIAFGYGSVASDFTSTVIGQYNNSLSSITTNGSATSYDADNTAFVIGNGTDDSNRSDAFKVMFNGDASVSNDLTVSGDVVISSDARLKSNIVSLGSTLSKLLQVDGKTYVMNGKQKIGVLAQEIKEVFPELVTKDENENLAVNYQGLVPVLINALKEQEERIKRIEELLLD